MSVRTTRSPQDSKFKQAPRRAAPALYRAMALRRGQSFLIVERERCVKAALAALLNTGAGVCLARRLAACGQEASNLAMLDVILCWCPPDIRRSVATFVIETDIEALCARENHFLKEHRSLVGQVIFAAQGGCGYKGFACQPHEETVYLDLEHHYNCLLEAHALNMSRGEGCLRRYADVCARLGIDSRARVPMELLYARSHVDFSPVAAPACSCGVRKSMPRATFWNLLQTEPLSDTAVPAIEMHFAARREELFSVARSERFDGREEKRLRAMVDLYPARFTRAWCDDTINALSGATAPEELPRIPPDTVQCYLSDMLRYPHTHYSIMFLVWAVVVSYCMLVAGSFACEIRSKSTYRWKRPRILPRSSL